MAIFPVSGVGLTSTSLSEWLNGQDTERMQRYRSYLDFYEGNQWDRRRRAGETRLTINYARALVRKVASYVFPEPVVFNVPADNETGAEAANRAERALNEFAVSQDLHALDFQTLIDTAVLGDGCFKVTWDPVSRSPVVASVDPSGLWAWTQPDNIRVLRRVVQRYALHGDEAAALFGVEAGSNSRLQVVEDWTASRVRVEVQGSIVRDEANPYGWIPYVLFPNFAKPHELWGESDLADLLDVCREINRRMTVISRILQVSGNPIVVLENVSGSEGIRADEGALWELPEDSKAYLLDMLSGGGVGLHIQYIELLFRALHDLAETPRTAFGDSGRALSGAALEVEVQPLVQKVYRKRRVWDAVYRRRNEMLLDLMERFGGLDLGGARRSVTIWGPVLPSDRDGAVANEARLVAAGIRSRRGAMESLGDENADAEWTRVLEEWAMAALTPNPSPNTGRGEDPIDDLR